MILVIKRQNLYSMIFKYKELRKFYNEIKKRGKVELFKNWNEEKVFLIRHDVDFDIKLAHNMASIENELGIVSTYFILTTCHSYNVLSEQNRKMLSEMVDMGHEIGLHFDPTLYTKNLDSFVDKEAAILSLACGTEVKSISLHNPSIHGQYPLFNNYINAYDPAFFSDKNYISDSCFGFRGKNPFEFIDGIENSMIQVLLHPMHFSENGLGYDDIMVASFLSYMNEIHHAFLVNATYKKQVGNDFMKLLKSKL